MIGTLERPTSTYDAKMRSGQDIRYLYAGLARSIANQNSTVILNNFNDDSINNHFDLVATSGSYPPFPFWVSPIELKTTSKIKPHKLSLKEAQVMALKALVSAEERRQREREAEANYWAELD